MDALDAILFCTEGIPDAQLGPVIDRAVRGIRSSGLGHTALQRLASPATTAQKWLRAALTELEDDYRAVTTADGRQLPEILVKQARFAQRGEHPAMALDLLRLALGSSAPYMAFLRAEGIAKKCRSVAAVKRHVKVALLGSCTTALFKPVLDLLLLRDGIAAEFYEAPFGTYRQEIGLDDTGLYRFDPDFVVLLLSHRDAALKDCSLVAHQIECLWTRLLNGTRAHILQPSFVPPQADPYLALSTLLPDGQTRLLRQLNTFLLEKAPARVTLLDTARIAASTAKWEDPYQWSANKLYPCTDAYPVLGEHLASCMRSILGLSKKLLVLDLDNTLWGGVIGEDGLGGIELGPPSAIGERYQDLHLYLKALNQRGIPLAVISKNNHADAAAVFEKHDGCILKLNDFAGFKANWQDKSTNLRLLANELSLGLDSFVFLDDNPAERAAVRHALPEVSVPEITGEPADSIAALEQGLYFQAIHFTEEDRQRTASYQAKRDAHALSETAASVEDYLAELDTRVQVNAVDATTLARVTQLVNKTNQFNLTSTRFTESELAERMQRPSTWFHCFRVQDRFADHGLTGVILAEQEQDSLRVDLWLMSCRVIGRGVEDMMFNALLTAARNSGINTIKARYTRTAKNDLVSQLLPKYGFTATSVEGTYELRTDAAAVLPCPHLREIC